MKINKLYSIIGPFVIALGISLGITQNAFSQCGTPVVGASLNITPNSATVLFGCGSCTAGSQILEYGISGFTPGTGAAAGVGGTVVTFPNITSTYTINGLQPSTAYRYYSRLNCGGGVFTPNSSAGNFTTAFDCSVAPVISCNSNINVTTTTGSGAWLLCVNGGAKEKIYSFTPTVSGTHYLVAPFPNSQVYFAYKAASLGCNDQSWSCIGLAQPTYMNQFALGPLTAGTQYFIAVDPNNSNVALNANFRIECPYCAAPTNITSTSTPYSISLNWTGSSGVIEYGPQGFIPGTGTTAGSASSTVISGGPGTTISNLTSSTVYDFYVRINCGGGNYSPNSIKYSAVTAACPFVLSATMGTQLNMVFAQQPIYPNFNNCSTFMPGGENLVTFTAPSTGYFNLNVVNGNYANGYGYSISSRVYNASCNLTGYSNCLSPSFNSATDNYTVGPFTAGTTYEFLFDSQDTTTSCQFPPCPNSLAITFSCPTPSGVSISNIQPNQITATWTCNCPATTYLEYGLAGFTPGTTAAAGAGGTVISGVSSPYNLTGLLADTKYDIYFRSSCAGSFTANSSVIHIKTAQSCASASTLTCGSYFTYSVATSGPQVGGSWAPTTCGGATDAKEKMWRFTPAVTANYSLFIHNFSANSINYQYPIKIFTKTASQPCDEQNWICAASASFSDLTFVPTAIAIGTLNAGTTYLILVDGVQPTFTAGYTYFFRIECPNTCGSPVSNYVASITSTSAQISGACNNCTGTTILEYGPSGFTPGTGATPGVGGTLITNFSYPVTISGLNPGTAYSVYVRQNCGGSLGYSSNQGPANFTTSSCSTAPTSITNSLGNNLVCQGTSFTLTQNGGVPGAGGSMKWYTGSCGGTLIGTGNSITVSPTSSTVYYVRAESACGNSSCAQIAISVNPLPTATITASGPTTFCAGGSVTFNANTGTGLTYVWKKYANVIAGATSSSYNTTGAGSYKCIVTNSGGCSKSSNAIVTVVNPLPTATITANGPTTFCAGDSVKLSANSGAGLTYQWKKYSTNIAGATLVNYTAKQAGKYKCIVTNSNGCSKSSNSITVAVPCREGDFTTVKNTTSTVIIYPNPANHDFTIDLGEEGDNDVQVTLTDISGRNFNHYLIEEDPGIYRVKNLATGVYLVRINKAGDISNYKVLIQ